MESVNVITHYRVRAIRNWLVGLLPYRRCGPLLDRIDVLECRVMELDDIRDELLDERDRLADAVDDLTTEIENLTWN